MELDTITPDIPTNKWFDSDEQFQLMYPASINQLANKHWTPLDVAQKAASFLAIEKNTRILDIGSGVGMFCLAAAHFSPGAFYTGVEQRGKLVEYANDVKDNLGLKNIEFIHGNFTQVDFKKFDHFYFFNSFYENFDFTEKIDHNISYSGELYNYYTQYLKRELDRKPVGTRLVTFHSMEDEIPDGYLVVGTELENSLKYWIKF